MPLDYHKLLDFIFPPSVDERLIRQTSESDFLNCYRPQTTSGITALSSFHDERLRAAIHLTKYHRHSKATKLLGTMLHRHLVVLDSAPTVIIPIPLSATRLRTRGYNQVELVASEAVKSLPTCVVKTDILYRTRDTVPQTTLSRQERIKNMAGAFAARQGGELTKQHVLLLDDVITTGATLKAAEAALLPLSPASLTLVALAH